MDATMTATYKIVLTNEEIDILSIAKSTRDSIRMETPTRTKFSDDELDIFRPARHIVTKLQNIGAYYEIPELHSLINGLANLDACLDMFDNEYRTVEFQKTFELDTP